MASQTLIQISDFLEKYECVSFVGKVPDRLKCIICNNILKNAKQTSCGCKVCERCIRDYLANGEKSCPSNQPDCMTTKLMMNRDIHQDNATNKEIANIEVHCPFQSCQTTDKIRNIVTHIEACEYREIECDKCHKRYPHKERLHHDKETCEERMVTCQYCKVTMTDLILRTIHLDPDHVDLCSEYIVICPNECGKDKVNLKEHLLKCTNKKLDCPMKPMGCRIGKLTRAKLINHLQEESVSHLQTLVREISEQNSTKDTLSKNIKKLQEDLRTQMNDIKSITEFRLKTERTIEELKRKGPGTTVQRENNVPFRNATFIWKIQNYESLKSDAESGGRASVTSDPFYTSEFGYKMCLRIYPAGDGLGRGNHLSVFFALMKGDYDDILSWPFKQKVTLSLLDQLNNGAKNHSDTFKPDARSACYQKPVDECNIASGSPKFIPLSSLLPSSVYYQEDTLYLKISVDTIGISKP